MSRTAKQTTALFGFVGALALVALVALAPRAARVSAASSSLTPGASRSTLIRAGLDAEALAAAGLSVAQASSAVYAAENAIASDPARLTSADAAYVAARQSHDALGRKIESGRASPQEIAGYADAQSALATAEANRAAALDAIFAAGTQALSPAQRAVLAQIRANAHWKLPIEFLTVERAEADWVALRDALSNERICAKLDQEPNAASQALLASARANATVSAAKAALDTNLPAVNSAWESETSN